MAETIDQTIRRVLAQKRLPPELRALTEIARYIRAANPQSLEEAECDLAIVRMIAEEVLQPDHLYQLEPETISGLPATA